MSEAQSVVVSSTLFLAHFMHTDLHHEVVDDPVEDGARVARLVLYVALHQTHQILHRAGRDLPEQTQCDVTLHEQRGRTHQARIQA